MTDDEKRAAFRLVADEVRGRILKGTYEPRTKLPTEAQLADEFGVSRLPVGQGLRLLASEGLLSKGRSGAFVAPIVHKIPRDATPRRLRRDEGPTYVAIDAEIRALGMTPTTVTSTMHVQPPPWVADLLGTDANTTAMLARVHRMLADDVPVQFATSYLPPEREAPAREGEADASAAGPPPAEHGPLQISEQVAVRLPQQEEIEALAMDVDQRVMEISRIARTEAGQTVEVTVYVLPAHLWTLTYSWPPASPS